MKIIISILVFSLIAVAPCFSSRMNSVSKLSIPSCCEVILSSSNDSIIVRAIKNKIDFDVDYKVTNFCINKDLDTLCKLSDIFVISPYRFLYEVKPNLLSSTEYSQILDDISTKTLATHNICYSIHKRNQRYNTVITSFSNISFIIIKASTSFCREKLKLIPSKRFKTSEFIFLLVPTNISC